MDTLKLSPQLKAFGVFALSIGLSYRSLEPTLVSQVFQLLLLLITMLAFLRIVYTPNTADTGTEKTSSRTIVAPMLWFTMGSVLVGFLAQQDIYPLFTAVIPLAFFMMGAICVVKLKHSGVPLIDIIQVALVTALAATLLRPFFYLYVQGGDVDTGRWQFLSNAMPIAVSYCVVRLFAGFKIKHIMIAAGVATVTMLSLTRTALLYPVAQMVFVALSKPKLLVRPQFITSVLLLAIAVPMGLGIVSTVKPELMDKWYTRLIGDRAEHGVDITALGRSSERTYQLDKFKTSWSSTLIGHGLAAEIHQSGEAAAQLAMILGEVSVYDYAARGFGHNMPVSLLYLGGIVFSLPVFILLFCSLVWAYLILWRTPVAAFIEQPLLLLIPFSAVAYMICGNLGILLGDRCGGGFYGIVLGLTYVLYKTTKTKGLTNVTPPTLPR